MKLTPSEKRMLKRFDKNFVNTSFNYMDGGMNVFVGDAIKIKSFLIKEVRRARREVVEGCNCACHRKKNVCLVCGYR